MPGISLSAICTLQGGQSLADLERDLLELLDYSHFALVKELIQNRLTVVWCTRLARAQDEDEERRIEVRNRRNLYVDVTPAAAAHSTHYCGGMSPRQASACASTLQTLSERTPSETHCARIYTDHAVCAARVGVFGGGMSAGLH